MPAWQQTRSAAAPWSGRAQWRWRRGLAPKERRRSVKLMDGLAEGGSASDRPREPNQCQSTSLMSSFAPLRCSSKQPRTDEFDVIVGGRATTITKQVVRELVKSHVHLSHPLEVHFPSRTNSRSKRWRCVSTRSCPASLQACARTTGRLLPRQRLVGGSASAARACAATPARSTRSAAALSLHGTLCQMRTTSLHETCVCR